MLDYVHSELYKVSRRKGFYITTGVLMALEFLLVLIWAWLNRENGDSVNISTSTGLSLLMSMLMVGYYCAIFPGDIVFSDQYKHNTLKNEVSFGLPRARCYLGKLITAGLLSLALCAVVVLWYGLLCALLLPWDGAWMEAVGQVGFALLAAVPLWLGCLSLTHMLFFSMKSTNIATLIVVGVLQFAGNLIKLLAALVHEGFRVLYQVQLTSPIDNLSSKIGDWSVVGQAWGVGIGWILVTTLIGLAVFRHREIS